MLDVAHLSYVKDLDVRIMSSYTHTYEQHACLRAPKFQELVAADNSIWDEIFRRARQPNWSLDQAVNEVLQNGKVERELGGRPTIPRTTLEALSKGSGKGDQAGAFKKARTGKGEGAKGSQIQQHAQSEWNKKGADTKCEQLISQQAAIQIACPPSPCVHWQDSTYKEHHI